jgi:inhibitor of cysteine peptidase
MVGSYVLSFTRMTALVAACLMHFPGAVSFADSEKVPKIMLTLVETDNDRMVDIRVGDTVRITLPENATTGYRWAIDHYDKEFIEAIATEPKYTKKAIGSGGEVSFLFQGKKAGTGEIALKNWRSWEGDSSVTSRFRLRLNVQP